MPMVYQQNINSCTRLGVWHISEPESFFTEQVPLKREITHPNKRLQHLAGRLLLKELYPDFPSELIKIAETLKPFLESEMYHFSISHCGSYAAAIVSKESRVGVDVERITDKVNKVKHKFLSNAELSLIENLAGKDEELYKTLLTTAWGIKESLFKWYGVGELDFIDHMHIEHMLLDDNSGFAKCKLVKALPIELVVHFLFFNGNCISWVVS
jgi:phosphopantetheinyl transferase